MFERLALVGCGLIGGSFALALKRSALVEHVVGFDRDGATAARARQLGVVDAVASSAQAAAGGADLVLVAVPVAASEATFAALRDALAPGTLVMDVGSTKCDVIEAARRGMPERLAGFVPAHPVSGREVAGVEHAEASLFDGRHVVLTPIDATSTERLRRATQTWQGIGAQVLTMTPEDHDGAMAAVSHLPHLLSFAYINALATQPGGSRALDVAGPGFRDFSRIAASNPAIWRDILLANRQQVLAQSRAFRETLVELEALIASGDADALEAAIDAARRTREPWRLPDAAPSKFV